MPRRNPMRLLASEENLARRMQYEREKRGWTPDGLAKRMTDVGCPIQQSSIWKIENGEPRRRITVNELVALAEVFEIEMTDLLEPPEAASNKEIRELLSAMVTAERSAAEGMRWLEEISARLSELLTGSEAESALKAWLTEEGREHSEDAILRTLHIFASDAAGLVMDEALRGKSDDALRRTVALFDEMNKQAEPYREELARRAVGDGERR